MAEDDGKRGFILYLDYAQHLDQLTDAEAGQLLRAIFSHEDPDKPEPALQPGAVSMAYSFIRAQLDRDRQKYEEKCERLRQNGSKGGRPKKANVEIENQEEPKETKRFSKKPTKPDTETETVTDTETETVTDTEKTVYTPPAEPDGENAKKEPLQDRRFDEFWKLYPKKVGKQAAKNSWKRIKPNAELFDRILAAVQKAKNSAQWIRNNGQYIPNPATWLNQGRWDDDLEPAAASGSTAPQGSGQKFDAGRYLKEKLASFEEG